MKPKLGKSKDLVGERRIRGEARAGALVDCIRVRSSENYVGIIMAENLRFLGEGSSAQGKPGAKARPRGVVDAHTVEIP